MIVHEVRKESLLEMMVDRRSPTECALNEKYGRENDRIIHWLCGIHQDFAGNTG